MSEVRYHESPSGDSSRPNPPPDRGPQQLSFLLRLWRSGTDGEWRASLQSVQSGERHIFADMENLFAFLVDQLRPPPEL